MNQEKFDLVRGFLSEAAMTEEERLLSTYRITPETNLPPMQPLFKMFGTPCFYRGELVAACGKAKSGKTLFLSILMAAGLTEKVLALERHTEITEITEPTVDGRRESQITENAENAVDKTTPTPPRSALPLSSERTVNCKPSTVNNKSSPLRVLWVDTEQSQQSTQDILVNRIIPLIKNSHTDRTDRTDSKGDSDENLNTDHTDCTDSAAHAAPAQKKSVRSVRSVCDLDTSLFAYNLRGLGFEKRREVVEMAIRTITPDLVIIDGIKDLITDINDAVQATQIMEHLMSLAQRGNCCIVNVLHQNKSESDRNMRGSIGTELTNKAFEVYECEYLNQHKMFCVTQTLSRRQRIGHELCYVLSKEGLPEQCDRPQEQPRDALGRWVSAKTKSEALVKLFNEAMEGHTQRRYTEVMGIALKKCGVADAQTYYDLVKEAQEQGIIRKATHPDTKESWLVLNDESVLPF